jgi:hypothetical protein
VTVIPFVSTVFPVVCIRPTISIIVYVVAPTSVILLLIFVEEVHGKWPLIPHASHLFLSQVPSVIMLGPVAWIGLLFIFATGVTALWLILAMAICKPCHVDIKRETWLASYAMTEIDHVDVRKRMRVNSHGKLTEE